MWFVTLFRQTFIFYVSLSVFSIKSYGRVKFLHANFCQLQIYHFSLQCQDSSIKYPLNEVPTNPKLLTNQNPKPKNLKPKTLKILTFWSQVCGGSVWWRCWRCAEGVADVRRWRVGARRRRKLFACACRGEKKMLGMLGNFDGWRILRWLVLCGVRFGRLDKAWRYEDGVGGRRTTFSVLEQMTRMGEEEWMEEGPNLWVYWRVRGENGEWRRVQRFDWRRKWEKMSEWVCVG